MPIISVVGLFYCDKFEETRNEKVVNMSKLTKSHFRSNRRFDLARLCPYRLIVYDLNTFGSPF